MSDVKELKNQIAEGFEELKAAVEQGDAERKEHGEALGETKAKIDSIQDDLDALEVKLDRARLSDDGKKDRGEMTEESKAFRSWAAKGIDGMDPEEIKLLSRSDEDQAGVLVPDPLADEMIEQITEMSPVRQFASARQTSSDSLTSWRKTRNTAAVWVGETESRSETQNPQFGKLRIPVFELFAKAQVSSQLLEDSAFDLEADLQADFAEQFAVAEGLAFVSGNGENKPRGLLETTDGGTASAVLIEEVTGGASGALDQDDVFKLQGQLKAAHQVGARLFFNRLTLRDIRMLKDSNNQYLFRPLEEGAANTVAGFPYSMLEDMPHSGSSGNKSILLGNMERAYRIVDRIGISVQRDPFTAADDGAVIFRARMRVGGNVRLAEAMKCLVIG